MKINLITLFSAIICTNVIVAQNIGIDTPNPTEKLHITGSLNITNGTIKANGVSGQSGQFLTNNGGNLAWANLTDFKYFHSISGFGTSESSTTWTVPAGVTKILVEVWGGGAGGNKSGLGGGGSGGDAGGYARGIITVVPGQMANITIGGGGVGLGPIYNSGNSGEAGHFTNFSVNLSEIQAKGGCYGCSNATIGDNYCSNCLASFEMEGQPGLEHTDRYEQISSTDFIRNKNYGVGGNAPFTYYNTGGNGENSFTNLTSSVLTIISTANSGLVPGGGGGGCSYASPGNYTCGQGGAGMVVIHY